MAPHDDDRNRGERRRRESATRERRDERRRSREQSTTRVVETHSRSRSKQTQSLSMDALAQLNQMNAAGIAAAEPSRPRKSRQTRRTGEAARGDYQVVDVEFETRRERTKTYVAQESGAEYDSPREAGRREREHSGAERSRERGRERRYDSPRRTKRRSAHVAVDYEYHRETEQRENEQSEAEVERRSGKRYESPRREKRRSARLAIGYEYDAGQEAAQQENHQSEAEIERGRERRHESRRRSRHRSAHVATDYEPDDEGEAAYIERRERRGKRKKRIVSGAIVEEGRAAGRTRAAGRDKYNSYNSLEQEKVAVYETQQGAQKKKKRWIIAGIALVLLIIIIVVAVVVSNKNKSKSSGGAGTHIDPSSIPSSAQGSYFDPTTWYDTTDFNVTYTAATVGDLPVMGLFTDWDDSASANDKVPALDKPWGDYAQKPARGVSLGGWLSIEPFITPSLFNYDSRLNVIDEWSLCTLLGPAGTASTLEKHYATFVTEQTFKDIRDAGLDHVRIPYSYWAVQTYDDDPYLFRVSWRYLLRGIEWARKYGLRVNLDLHALPGSQNGWNHSGHQGAIDWIIGPNGAQNRQRSLDVHDRLSKFFAQDRYKNVIAFYGLANEPQMLLLPADQVTAWTEQAFTLVRNNGLTWPKVVFGDGFMGLNNWQGRMTGHPDLILDVHQYVIFDNFLITLTHQAKVNYACTNWTQQAQASLNTATGYGPTMFAEWSQADTDCAQYLTNVGWGNRWTGTYQTGNPAASALTPRCPSLDASCTCDGTNGNFSPGYKSFLKMFAEAQMTSFEKGYGWWYWTWDTESATLWSYKQGLAAGILPAKAYDRDFNCDSEVPDFTTMGLSESV